MLHTRTFIGIIAATAAINVGLFAGASIVGWFDDVTASQNGEPLNAALIAVASVVGAAGLVALRVGLARWRGPQRARRLFMALAALILVLSLASPFGGLDDPTAGAITTLLATHVVTVIGGAVAAERVTKPVWGWGRATYTQRPLPPGAVAVVSGATGGIGSETALALAERGVRVIGVGRNAATIAQLEAAGAQRAGSIDVLAADLSSMREAERIGGEIAQTVDQVDLVIHAIGTLKQRSKSTEEGTDENVATSWLSRVALHRRLPIAADARVVNVAAAESAAEPPGGFVGLRSPDDFGTGMTAHGRAQLANDIWVASLQARGTTAFGYGPGAVDTGIRRELPKAIRVIMRPFFWWNTRRPADTALDIVRLCLDASLPEGGGFASRDGLFEHNAKVHDTLAQRDIEQLAAAMIHRATADRG